MTAKDSEDPRKRKRERDKQNQREKRRREKDTFQELERRNASLERQLKELYDGTSGDFKRLTDTVKSLRTENEALREKLRRVDQFVKSWTAEDDQADQTKQPPSMNENEKESGSLNPSRTPPAAPKGGHLDSRIAVRTIPDGFPNATGLLDKKASGSSAVESQESPELEEGLNIRSSVPLAKAASSSNRDKASDGNNIPTSFQKSAEQHDMTIEDIAVKLGELVKIPAWNRLPPNIEVNRCFDPFGSAIRDSRRKPEQLEMLNHEPTALELLFEASLNPLANAVYEATAHTPTRRTEKLAINYLNYLMTMWIINPTEKNWDRVPAMLCPTAVQLFIPHPPMFDYVFWPQMRDNFIHTGMKYCRPEVLRLLLCTSRIRNTPNSEFITWTQSGDPQIHPRFIEKISKIENWVLLDKFWIEYPELVNGMDADKFMISEQDLIDNYNDTITP